MKGSVQVDRAQRCYSLARHHSPAPPPSGCCLEARTAASVSWRRPSRRTCGAGIANSPLPSCSLRAQTGPQAGELAVGRGRKRNQKTSTYLIIALEHKGGLQVAARYVRLRPTAAGAVAGLEEAQRTHDAVQRQVVGRRGLVLPPRIQPHRLAPHIHHRRAAAAALGACSGGAIAPELCGGIARPRGSAGQQSGCTAAAAQRSPPSPPEAACRYLRGGGRGARGLAQLALPAGRAKQAPLRRLQPGSCMQAAAHPTRC